MQVARGYQVVYGNTYERTNFDHQVSELQRRGWVCQGGVALGPVEKYGLAQAMVLVGDDPQAAGG